MATGCMRLVHFAFLALPLAFLVAGSFRGWQRTHTRLLLQAGTLRHFLHTWVWDLWRMGGLCFGHDMVDTAAAATREPFQGHMQNILFLAETSGDSSPQLSRT